MAIPLGEQMLPTETAPVGGAIPAGPESVPGPEIPLQTRQQVLPGSQPGMVGPTPEDQGTDYTPQEDQLMEQLKGAAERIMYEDDETHEKTLAMINSAMQDPKQLPQQLAKATLMIVDQVDRQVQKTPQGTEKLPGVVGSIPEEILPGFAFEVYDMVWELASVQGIDISGQVKQQGITALTSYFMDGADLDQADAEYIFGGMNDKEDLTSVLQTMQTGVFADGIEGQMEEAKY